MEVHRPLVFVLTDGGGHAGAPRLGSTTRLIARAGATPAGGAFYGALSDRAMYELLLGADGAPFVRLAAELASRLTAAGVSTVAGDATEGYNPTHDVCRLIIDATVERLRRDGRTVRNLEFPLVAHPFADREPPAELLRLDDAALERKLAAARAYPEMHDEVERALAEHGPSAFATEVLWAAAPAAGEPGAPPPFYERHGDRRVREGVYRETIRHCDHVLPVASALRAWATAPP